MDCSRHWIIDYAIALVRWRSIVQSSIFFNSEMYSWWKQPPARQPLTQINLHTNTQVHQNNAKLSNRYMRAEGTERATPRAFNYLIYNFRCLCNRMLNKATRLWGNVLMIKVPSFFNSVVHQYLHEASSVDGVSGISLSQQFEMAMRTHLPFTTPFYSRLMHRKN